MSGNKSDRFSFIVSLSLFMWKDSINFLRMHSFLPVIRKWVLETLNFILYVLADERLKTLWNIGKVTVTLRDILLTTYSQITF